MGTATHERAFTRAYDLLGVTPPSIEPRATGHVPITYIQRIIGNGLAYASGRVGVLPDRPGAGLWVPVPPEAR